MTECISVNSQTSSVEYQYNSVDTKRPEKLTSIGQIEEEKSTEDDSQIVDTLTKLTKMLAEVKLTERTLKQQIDKTERKQRLMRKKTNSVLVKKNANQWYYDKNKHNTR